MLRNNYQMLSGKKENLAERVADGRVLGRIPRCPKCFGGRPSYNIYSGTYFCPGYMDDDQLIRCESTFTK